MEQHSDATAWQWNREALFGKGSAMGSLAKANCEQTKREERKIERNQSQINIHRADIRKLIG